MTGGDILVLFIVLRKSRKKVHCIVKYYFDMFYICDAHKLISVTAVKTHCRSLCLQISVLKIHSRR